MRFFFTVMALFASIVVAIPAKSGNGNGNITPVVTKCLAKGDGEWTCFCIPSDATDIKQLPVLWLVPILAALASHAKREHNKVFQSQPASRCSGPKTWGNT